MAEKKQGKLNGSITRKDMALLNSPMAGAMFSSITPRFTWTASKRSKKANWSNMNWFRDQKASRLKKSPTCNNFQPETIS